MPIDWSGLLQRLETVSGDSPRRTFFLALARRGQTAEAEGKSAIAAHCLGRVEFFLASASDPLQPLAASTTLSSPLEALGERWERLAQARAEAVLQRHRLRLSPAEHSVYAARLQSGPSAELPGLRHRLQDRLLRAYAQRRRGSGKANPAWISQGNREVMGPYNSLAVLQETLRRVSETDPQWIQEWTDLYLRMEKLRQVHLALMPNN